MFLKLLQNLPGGLTRDLCMGSPAQLFKMDSADFAPSNLCLHGFWNATKVQARNVVLKSIVLRVEGTLTHLFEWFLACLTIIVCLHDQSRDIHLCQKLASDRWWLALDTVLLEHLSPPLILSPGSQILGC